MKTLPKEYTFQEILDRLPKYIRDNGKTYFLDICFTPKQVAFGYINKKDICDYLYFKNGMLSRIDGIAYSTLCWTIEKGYKK